jgi:hypothetical protein
VRHNHLFVLADQPTLETKSAVTPPEDQIGNMRIASYFWTSPLIIQKKKGEKKKRSAVPADFPIHWCKLGGIFPTAPSKMVKMTGLLTSWAVRFRVISLPFFHDEPNKMVWIVKSRPLAELAAGFRPGITPLCSAIQVSDTTEYLITIRTPSFLYELVR